MKDYFVIPTDVYKDPGALRQLVGEAAAFARTLEPKAAKPKAARPKAAKPKAGSKPLPRKPATGKAAKKRPRPAS